MRAIVPAPLASLLDPIWRSTVIVDEPVLFIAASEHAETTGASLLFVPDGELSVTDTTGRTHYTEGQDFVIDREARRLTRPSGSRLPVTLPNALAVDDVGTVDSRLALVSYAHRGDPWSGYVPPDARMVLPRLRVRLQKGLPITIAVIGDSISEGYDASGFRSVLPNQPPYARLVADGLQQRHSGVVTLRNFAVAGSTSEDGRWVAADAAQHLPDLVLIAFGMNDACYASADALATNVSDIVARVAEVSPESECVIVTPMRPTAVCTWVDHERFTPYRDALQRLARRGVVVADVMTLWDAVLHRKHEQALSGNGSNHPNDFGHRLYAQTVLATLGVSGV